MWKLDFVRVLAPQKSVCLLYKIRVIHEKVGHLQAKYFWLKALIWSAAIAPLGRMAVWCFISMLSARGLTAATSLLPYVAEFERRQELLQPNGCSTRQQCCLWSGVWTWANFSPTPPARPVPEHKQAGAGGMLRELGLTTSSRIGLSRTLVLTQRHTD